MHTTVQRIESVGPGCRARRIFFEDGSPDCVTSKAAVKALTLEAGCEVNPDELAGELAAVEPPLARERALQLLGYRERSAFELRQRLCESGYSSSVADAVVVRFCEAGIVDDRRFAESWVRSRASSGHGRSRIRRELAEKGVDEVIAQEAIGQELVDDELSRAREALRGRVPVDAKDRERLLRRLVSRGFEFRVALEALSADAEEFDAEL